MKKLLLLFAMCSSLGAWAQDPNTYGSGDNMITLNAEGSTLTITGKGNIGDITAPITTTYFASPAVGNVFTSDAGAAVTTSLVYNPANKYYTASRDYTQVFEGGMPNTTGSYVSNITTTKSWNETKLTADDVYMYAVYAGSKKNDWNTAKLDAEYVYNVEYHSWESKLIIGERVVSGATYQGWFNSYKYNEIDYAPFITSNTPITITEITGDLEGNGFELITKENFEPNYISSNTPVVINGSRIINGNITSEIGTITCDGSTYAAYVITNEPKSVGANIAIGDPCMTVFTVDEINEYINYTTTFKCTSDKLYVSKDAGENKSLLANGNTYTYEAGDLYYIAGDATYHEIEDNAAYFTANPSYLHDDTQNVNIWPMLVSKINTAGYTELYLKSEGSAYATISNKVTQHMMKLTSVEVLDLSGVQIPSIGSGNPGESDAFTNGTFIVLNDANDAVVYAKNTSFVDLRLPHIRDAHEVSGNDHRHVPKSCCQQIGEQLTTVKMPDNATCIEKNAFSTGSGGFHLVDVTLNEGLERIGEEAFSEDHLVTLVIPETVKFIGKNAFKLNYLHDVYFLGKTAPIVGLDAFGSEAYVDNNHHEKPTATTNYTATRANYVNGAYMAAMLHLNPEMTLAERARFTDVTRDYHVFDLYETNTAETPTVNASAFKSTTTLGYRANKGEGDKDFVFWNGIDDDASVVNVATGSGFSTQGYNKLDAGGKGDVQTWQQNSAYYDTNVGEQYCWPSQANYCRAYAVATNGILYDGITKISEGIVNAGGTYTAASYDGDCDGTPEDWADGKEYIGLHQFILVTMDVNKNTKIDEWAFDFEGANWWTLCVPVDMTVAEVRKAFGEDTQVCKFSNVTRKADDKVKFFFTDEQCLGKDENLNAVEANFPYMIRPSKAKDATYKFTLPNYTLSPAQIPTPVPITVTDGKNGKSYTYTYIGQYNTNQNPTSDADKYLYMPQYSYYLGAEPSNPTYHKLYIQTGTTGKWKPYTCVILPSDGADDYATFFDPDRNASQEAKSVAGTLGLDDFEGFESATTGISNYEVICGSDAAPVYNLNGQKVDSDNLRKGIYIKNGVKFIVK